MEATSLPKIGIPHVGIPCVGLPTIGVPHRKHGLVIPKPIRDAMVCWYDPKKQGLTNEDIVTKYNQDLNKAYVRNSTATSIVSKDNKKVVLQNVNASNVVISIGLYYKDYINKPWSYTYSTDNVTFARIAIYNKDGSFTYQAQSSNGILNVPVLQLDEETIDKTVVMVFSLKNQLITSITITQLPTSILQDFSGNGRVGYCYNFAGNGSSGVGLYKCDTTITKTHIGNTYSILTQNEAKLDVVGSNYVLYNYNKVIPYVASFKVKITGIPSGGTVYYNYNKGGILIRFPIAVDGEYTVPDSEAYNGEIPRDFVSFIIKDNIPISNYSGLTIKFIPDYLNQICLDGVDDHIYVPNMPVFTDYTVIAARTAFEGFVGALAAKVIGENPKGFVFEGGSGFQNNTWSLGVANNIPLLNERITWQSKNSYNGTYIRSGLTPDITDMTIGGFRYWKGALGKFIVLNRSLTTDEEDWIENNLMKE